MLQLQVSHRQELYGRNVITKYFEYMCMLEWRERMNTNMNSGAWANNSARIFCGRITHTHAHTHKYQINIILIEIIERKQWPYISLCDTMKWCKLLINVMNLHHQTTSTHTFYHFFSFIDFVQCLSTPFENNTLTKNLLLNVLFINIYTMYVRHCVLLHLY